MNLKLIFSLSLLVGLLSNLIIVSGLLQLRWKDIPTLIILLFIIILILCAFVLPAWVIAIKVHSRRFLHSFMVGIIGWTIGLLALIFPVSLVITILALDVSGAELGQGVGILAFF